MSNRTILVVDNHPMILEFMSTLLSNEGYAVHTASSGLEAMEILKGIEPDFIFVDLIMPHIDGKRLCRLIRENERENIYFNAVGLGELDLFVAQKIYEKSMKNKKIVL